KGARRRHGGGHLPRSRARWRRCDHLRCLYRRVCLPAGSGGRWELKEPTSLLSSSIKRRGDLPCLRIFQKWGRSARSGNACQASIASLLLHHQRTRGRSRSAKMECPTSRRRAGKLVTCSGSVAKSLGGYSRLVHAEPQQIAKLEG